jgi:hypothetical protein
MTPQQQLELDSLPALRELPDSHGALPRKGTARFTAYPASLASTTVVAPRTVRLALAGCGVVGGGLVRLLHESAPAIAARFGVRFDVTSILVRDVNRERNVPLEARLFTNNLDAFLSHDADVVIEAVGGDEPARTIASSALSRGKKLITSNKELVASHGDSLSALAAENRVALDFGAAVGGSAPVISTLRDLVGASTPLSVRASVAWRRLTARGTWMVGTRQRSSPSFPGSPSEYGQLTFAFAERRWFRVRSAWCASPRPRERRSDSSPSVFSCLDAG